MLHNDTARTLAVYKKYIVQNTSALFFPLGQFQITQLGRGWPPTTAYTFHYTSHYTTHYTAVTAHYTSALLYRYPASVNGCTQCGLLCHLDFLYTINEPTCAGVNCCELTCTGRLQVIRKLLLQHSSSPGCSMLALILQMGGLSRWEFRDISCDNYWQIWSWFVVSFVEAGNASSLRYKLADHSAIAYLHKNHQIKIPAPQRELEVTCHALITIKT